MNVDKAAIECRFKRSMESYDENAHVQKMVVRKLAALLTDYCPRIDGDILEVGCGTGLLTALLQQTYGIDRLFVNDLVEEMCRKTAGRCQLSSRHCIVGDIEQIELQGEFELIVSASTFQWFARPAETFRRFCSYLKQGGWLVFSTFGPDNFRELKSVTGSGLEYCRMEEMAGLLSSCFEVLHTEEEHHVLDFNTPLEVLHHVKKTGVNAATLPISWTRGRLEKFSLEYFQHFASEGRYFLTYHPQYFICRKRFS